MPNCANPECIVCDTDQSGHGNAIAEACQAPIGTFFGAADRVQCALEALQHELAQTSAFTGATNAQKSAGNIGRGERVP